MKLVHGGLPFLLALALLGSLAGASATPRPRPLEKLRVEAQEEDALSGVLDEILDDSLFDEVRAVERILTSPSSDGNLIANGGFEFATGRQDPINFNFSINLINTSIPAPHNDIQNWSVCGIVNYILNEAIRPYGPRLVQLGYYGEDLYSKTCNGWVSSVAQTVITERGAKYNLSFDVGPFFDTSCKGSTTLFPRIDPSDYLQSNNVNLDLLRVNTTFERQYIIFTAYSNVTVISFNEPPGERTPCYFSYIDNVTLYAVPKSSCSVIFARLFPTLATVLLISAFLF